MNTTHARLGAAAVVAGAFALTMTVGPADAAPAQHAEATIVDLSGNEIGFARFVQDADGTVHVNVKVAGLPAGNHGVHLHETGSCASVSGAFSGAGAHYNPTAAQHADHAGDLPNLIVNDDLQGRLNASTQRVTLSDGPTTLFDTIAGKVGSAIVIHANEDDFGPIANGNSGGRIACGVIVSG